MGYDASFVIPRPPESKHKGAMTSLYEFVGMIDNTLACSHQYKHGQDSWSLTGDYEPFDVVVFLGVPMVDKGIGFEEDQVREIFAPMCTEDFEMVDIYYGLPSSVKWFNGEEKDTTSMMDVAFSIRSTWDDDVKTGGGSSRRIRDHEKDDQSILGTYPTVRNTKGARFLFYIQNKMNPATAHQIRTFGALSQTH